MAMELYIETLTGTAFELRVSPFETVMSVKAKIQRLEGIPISHQHLIWQSTELEDDFCLHDYNIHSGATLKLVLAVRGGPINTRRVAVEDSAFKEMAEYMEANRDDILDKLPSNSNVTLLVFREGDKLNFFRVVDPRPDGSVTPLSETMYSPMYNVRDEEDDDDDDVPRRDKMEENARMREKMSQLRLNMEAMTLSKKKKPPKTPTQGSGPHSGVSRLRLRGLSNAGRPPSNNMSPLNRNMRLPPVGHTFLPTQPADVAAASACAASSYTVDIDNLAHTAAASGEGESVLLTVTAGATNLSVATGEPSSPIDEPESAASEAELKDRLGEEIGAGNDVYTSATTTHSVDTPIETALLIPHPPFTGPILRRGLLRLNSLAETPHSFQSVSSKRHDTSSLMKTLQQSKTGLQSNEWSAPKETGMASGTNKVAEKWEHGSTACGDSYRLSPISTHKDIFLESFLRPSTTARRKELALEGFSSSDARTMSGILRQASIEKLGTSHLGGIVNSGSKSRMANYCPVSEAGRVSTPESRFVPSRLQRISVIGGERQRVSPTHRLPPVKAKKKHKRCFMCGRKTGLATSYQCRCGNNFCASHRYAESHDCTFDYKTEGRKLLEQNNPLVSAPKLPKI